LFFLSPTVLKILPIAIAMSAFFALPVNKITSYNLATLFQKQTLVPSQAKIGAKPNASFAVSRRYKIIP